MSSYPTNRKFTPHEVQALFEALAGISSCGTRCPCCEMHRQIAERTLAPYLAEPLNTTKLVPQ